MIYQQNKHNIKWSDPKISKICHPNTDKYQINTVILILLHPSALSNDFVSHHIMT